MTCNYSGMGSTTMQRWKIEDAPDELAYQEGVEEAKEQLMRVAEQLDKNEELVPT